MQDQATHLEHGVKQLKQAQNNFHSTTVSVAARSSTSAKVTQAPHRPVKRKSDILELSDSEDERTTKRRQVGPSTTAAAAAAISSTASSTSTSKNSVKPWDQVHTGKKLHTASKPEVTVQPKKKTSTTDLVELSAQQRAILDVVVKEGKNVFFTGSAGSLFCHSRLA